VSKNFRTALDQFVWKYGLDRLILVARHLCAKIEDATMEMPLDDPAALVQYLDEWIEQEQAAAEENTRMLRHATHLLGRPQEGVEDEGKKKVPE